MNFEWDENKDKINIKKHGVSFDTASRIFLDPNRIEKFDINNSDYEDRIISIGFYEKVLYVVYTERMDNIRIISARKADKGEINEYYQANNFRRN